MASSKVFQPFSDKSLVLSSLSPQQQMNAYFLQGQTYKLPLIFHQARNMLFLTPALLLQSLLTYKR